MAYEKFPMWTHKKGEASRIVHSQEELEKLGDGWSNAEYAPPKVHIDSATFQHYPKWIGDRLVHSAEEEAALAPAAPAGSAQTDERATLIQIAEEKGVQIDKRWSAEKIRAALEAA